MSQIDICIHHTDADGWSSAAIVGAKKNFGVGYGTPLNNSALLNMVSGQNVAIVDFSFPRDTMDFIIKLAKSVLWIDHHLDSQPLAELFEHPKVTGIHDVNKAGCQLTWEWFRPDEPMPNSIKYIADRDIWTFEYEDTRPYNYGLSTLPQTADPADDIWNDLLNDNFEGDIISAGKILMHSIENDCMWHARMRAQVCGEGDKKFILTNCTSMVSEVAEYLIKTFDIPIVLTWDLAKGKVALHGRGKGARDFFHPLLKGHPDACGAKLELEEGFEFIQKLYKKSRRVMPR